MTNIRTADGLRELVLEVAQVAQTEGMGFTAAAEKVVNVTALSPEAVECAVLRYIAGKAGTFVRSGHQVEGSLSERTAEAMADLSDVVVNLADALAQQYIGMDGTPKRVDEMEKPDRDHRLRTEKAIEARSAERRAFWERANAVCEKHKKGRIADLPMSVRFELARLATVLS